MAENLKVTHYRNGNVIPDSTNCPFPYWEYIISGAYCDYNGDSSIVAEYGRLYNWYALTDSRELAPAGWHVPSDEEWKQLEIYLGMIQSDANARYSWRGTDQGGQLKESGTVHWNSPNLGASNSSGFTALPAGSKTANGTGSTYGGLGQFTEFWSTTEYGGSWAFYRELHTEAAQIYRMPFSKSLFLSIRCIKGEIHGVVKIETSPDSLNAPWWLSGPDGFAAGGTGDSTLTGLDPGNYSLTWQNVSGWDTPTGSSQYLTVGDTVTFEGEYIEQVGVIVIDSSPDSLNAPWNLSGPNGYTFDGAGDTLLIGRTLGQYTIVWGRVSGWTTPPYVMMTLEANDTLIFSCAYVEDSTDTITDIDGNIYLTIKIGSQWWMAENLAVTHYRNGDSITDVTDYGTWAGLVTGACCNFANDPELGAIFGKLYNWYAITDSRNIAPYGWHIATVDDWQTLSDYLGGDQIAGGKLKEAGTAHWNSPNVGASNESGFSALPGGLRDLDGDLCLDHSIGSVARFWSSSYYEIDSSFALVRFLYTNTAEFNVDLGDLRCGLSVRCVRDGF